jgi:hypothetical protein
VLLDNTGLHKRFRLGKEAKIILPGIEGLEKS